MKKLAIAMACVLATGCGANVNTPKQRVEPAITVDVVITEVTEIGRVSVLKVGNKSCIIWESGNKGGITCNL